MRYPDIRKAVFLERPNRFIAYCEVDGERVAAHVKNTGRCKELLIPGAAVYLQHHDDPARKTAWSLITVEKEGRLFNLDSQAPNQLAAEAIASGALTLPGFETPDCILREQRFGDSRFDLKLVRGDRTAFVEVKGVTLDVNGVALFPDAPTERGVKHLLELQKAAQAGYGAFLLFVIQMEGIRAAAPNDRTHPAFGETLRAVTGAGVLPLAAVCEVWPDGAEIRHTVEVLL